MLTLAEAALAAGLSKSALLKAIKAGRLSAVRDDNSGRFSVDPAELRRAYPSMDALKKPSENVDLIEKRIHEDRVRELRHRIDELTEDRSRLWRQLEAEQQERAKLYGLLTHFQAEAEKNPASGAKKAALMTAFALLFIAVTAVAVYLVSKIN
jgi:hypothetical protein